MKQLALMLTLVISIDTVVTVDWKCSKHLQFLRNRCSKLKYTVVDYYETKHQDIYTISSSDGGWGICYNLQVSERCIKPKN